MTTGEAEPDSYGAEFADQLGELFRREHQLPPPPKPITYDFSSIRDYSHFYENFDGLPREYRPESSIEQKIEWAQESVARARQEERSVWDKARQKENFGQRFTLVNSFSLENTKTDYEIDEETQEITFKKVIDPRKDVPLANRLDFYRYLQQLGLIMVDDTGLNEYGNAVVAYKSRVMLPESVDRDTFYTLEDEVRAVIPFTQHEVHLMHLQETRACGAEAGNFRVDPDVMRALVDYLATDERFMGMFMQSEELVAARREKRRASPEDAPLTEIIRDEDEQTQAADYFDTKLTTGAYEPYTSEGKGKSIIPSNINMEKPTLRFNLQDDVEVGLSFGNLPPLDPQG